MIFVGTALCQFSKFKKLLSGRIRQNHFCYEIELILYPRVRNSTTLTIILFLLQTWPRYIQWTNLFDWIVYSMAIALVVDVDIESTETGIRTVRNLSYFVICSSDGLANLVFTNPKFAAFFDFLKTDFCLRIKIYKKKTKQQFIFY